MKNEFILNDKKFRAFCIYRLLFGISYSIMIPIIPLFFKSIGMETVTIGMVISLYGVSKTIMQIPFGIVCDKIGDKSTLKLALLLMGVVPIGYVLSNTSLQAGSLYVIQGAILGMAAPATYSVLARTLNVKRRGECTGLASAVFTLGGGIGAAIASFILTKLNNFSMAFNISSLGIFFTLIYVIIRVNKVKPINNKDNKKESIKEILYEIRRRKFVYKIIILSSSAFLGDYIYSCVVALIHFYGQDVLHVSTSYTSSIISVYLLVFGLGAPIAGWVSDKIGNKKQLLYSFFTMNFTLLGLIITRNVTIFTIIIILYFLGATYLNASVQSCLSEFGSYPKIKGFVFGVVGASESLGYAVGPLVSSYIYEYNKNYLFLGLLMVSIFITAIYVVLFNKSGI